MSERKWTKNQLDSILLTGKNILVSAAAGSGKTAVLTQRVIRLVVDKCIDIDRIAVVTFTKAAAAEMKSRIRKELGVAALDAKSITEANRINDQITLLQDAMITTIDSFCLNIIRTHFEDVGIDPGVRVGDQGELSLIEAEAFEDAIEEMYETGEDDFYDFLTVFGGKKNDSGAYNLIKMLYDSASNTPWPNEWIENITDIYENTNSKNGISEIYLKQFNLNLQEICDLNEEYKHHLAPYSGFAGYIRAIDSDMEQFDLLLHITDICELASTIQNIKFKTLSSGKSDIDEDLKIEFKSFRDSYKKYINKIANTLVSYESEDEIIKITENAKKYINVIKELLNKYDHFYTLKKQRRNIISFNDIEHLALNVLMERKDGVSTPTPAAMELKQYYEEIMIDEYQDTNLLQEEILEAISRSNNRYMVGDIKQSIYGFRKARPDIFALKYHTFKEYDKDNDKEYDDNTKIILGMNFRSRAAVLDSVNSIFEHAMNEDYTGVKYSNAEFLVAGLDIATAPENKGIYFDGEEGRTEIICIEKDKTDTTTNQEYEAMYVADRINEYINKGYCIFDTSQGIYRKLRYSDIVILLRSTSNAADIYTDILTDKNIPAYSQSSEKYTDTPEVRPVMSLLRLIDNPLDDVACAAILRSYFGRFSMGDIAKIKLFNKDEFLYKNIEGITDCKDYEEDLKTRLLEFRKQITDYRKYATESDIYDLIWHIIYDSGYYSYIEGLPLAKRRLANLRFLLDRSKTFDGTSYTGLFQFLRFVEKIKEAKLDEGEVSALGENDNVVRIMTIHKSKGLEFPVVFVCGMTKRFNMEDVRKKLICHDRIGLGIEYADAQKRIRKDTIFRQAIANEVSRDIVSEEMRMLYVAMTRAREKLILTGTDTSENFNKLSNGLRLNRNNKMTGEYLNSVKNFFEFCIPIVKCDSLRTGKNFFVRNINSYDIKKINTKENAGDFTAQEKKDIENNIYSDGMGEPFALFYPYESEMHLKPKMTVTELKNAAISKYISEHELESDNNIYQKTDINDFRAGGVSAGNAYHRLMENIDFDDTDDENAILAQSERLLAKGILNKNDLSMINFKDIKAFFDTDLGKISKLAYTKGCLFREKEFMIGINTKDRSDPLLVQGIIDMYIKESDGIIIVDYKTDRVNKLEGETQLLKRYKVQMKYYKIALEQALGIDVKKVYIYSFCLNKAIEATDLSQ